MNKPMTYVVSVGEGKPHSGRQPFCPFCHPETLVDILETKSDMIWLMNKYPVFDRTWPTVLIETSVHDSELTKYKPEKAAEVISFGVEKWLETEADKRFRSAIFFRNYGKMSGGSQRHPHSQILGLMDYDWRENISEKYFAGSTIHEDADAIVRLSTEPVCGMGELDVELKTDGGMAGFASAIQKTARFILRDFPTPCTSYNLFFYHMKRIHVKIFPRYTTGPLYMGYRITQVMDEASRLHIINTLRSEKYFGD